MTYGFNDDKSKAEIYSKNDFKKIRGTIELSGHVVGKRIFSQSLLEDLGIDNIYDWFPITIMHGELNDAGTYYKDNTFRYVEYVVEPGTQPLAHPTIYMGYTQQIGNSLHVEFYNRYNSTRKFYFEILLMRAN